MNSILSTDICIIGAGPGGVTSAITLAQKGIPSVVLEKSVFPRDKVCGDAFSGRASEILKRLNPELIDQLFEKSIILESHGTCMFAPNMKGVRIPFHGEDHSEKRTLGFISRRFDFDSFFASEMEKYPEIKLLEDYRTKSFTKSNGKWIITADNNSNSRNNNPEISAKLIIAADGANSRFANQVAGRRTDPRYYGAGIRAYFMGVEGLDPDGFIELYFLKSLLPGYLWIFPLPDSTANTGVWTRSDLIRKKRINLKSELQTAIHTLPGLQERFSNARMTVPPEGFTLPLGSRRERIAGPGYMLVGDAACLVDPFTGEGIGSAMVSGALAAEQATQCMQSDDFSEDNLRPYDSRVQAILGRELLLGRRLQRLARHPQLFNFIANRAQQKGIVFNILISMFQNLDRSERSRSPLSFLNLIRRRMRI